MHYDRLKEEALGRLLCGKNTDALQNDCDLIIFLLENCEIEVRDEDRFFVKVRFTTYTKVICKIIEGDEKEIEEQMQAQFSMM